MKYIDLFFQLMLKKMENRIIQEKIEKNVRGIMKRNMAFELPFWLIFLFFFIFSLVGQLPAMPWDFDEPES